MYLLSTTSAVLTEILQPRFESRTDVLALRREGDNCLKVAEFVSRVVAPTIEDDSPNAAASFRWHCCQYSQSVG